MIHDVVLLVHVLGAVVLAGTGMGIAFFMLMAHRTGDPAFVAKTAAVVVVADTLFTATAAIAQPITGYILTRLLGWSLWEPWVTISLALYVLIGVFWLPVVWMQIRMRDMARAAVADGAALPDAYHRLFRLWFACGIPAFVAIVAIFWLMLTKPPLW